MIEPLSFIGKLKVAEDTALLDAVLEPPKGDLQAIRPFDEDTLTAAFSLRLGSLKDAIPNVPSLSLSLSLSLPFVLKSFLIPISFLFISLIHQSCLAKTKKTRKSLGKRT
jgi:hypothetical protein